MLTLILVAIAAVCNAVMDICAHKFEKSIFCFRYEKTEFHTKWNEFFNTYWSWRNKYENKTPSLGRRKIKVLGVYVNYPVQLTDSFHLFKSVMIVCWAFAVVFYHPFVYYSTPTVNLLTDVLILGTTWNITFSLFYKHILLKK